jgi:hypothetical protein
MTRSSRWSVGRRLGGKAVVSDGIPHTGHQTLLFGNQIGRPVPPESIHRPLASPRRAYRPLRRGGADQADASACDRPVAPILGRPGVRQDRARWRSQPRRSGGPAAEVHVEFGRLGGPAGAVAARGERPQDVASAWHSHPLVPPAFGCQAGFRRVCSSWATDWLRGGCAACRAMPRSAD